MRRIAHRTLGFLKHAVSDEAAWEFKPGERVLADGFFGTVQAVQDGPYGGYESYEVLLDQGMGGGEYTAAQLSRPDTVTASAVIEAALSEVLEPVEATSTLLANHWYPELGNILTERPPIERIERTASLQIEAKVHFNPGHGGPICGAGARWNSVQLSTTKGTEKVDCEACKRTQAYQQAASQHTAATEPLTDVMPPDYSSAEQPDVCSFCGNPGPWTDAQDTGRGLRLRCGTCGGTMRLNSDEEAGTSGIQWMPENFNSPENHASRQGDPRATIHDPRSVHGALSAPCETPGAQYSTEVHGDTAEISVKLPFDLPISSASDADHLEAHMHNAMEEILAPYFVTHSALNVAASAEAGYTIFDAPELAAQVEAQISATAASLGGYADEELTFHFTASWADVQKKAKRIREEGGVRIVAASHLAVVGEVQGDTAVYESALNYVPGSRKLANWECGCKWASYAWGRSPAYRRFEGRLCSHALALQYEAGARSMFGQDVTPDRFRLPDQHPHHPVQVQHQRGTERAPERELTRRERPPGNMRRTWDPKSRVRVKGSLHEAVAEHDGHQVRQYSVTEPGQPFISGHANICDACQYDRDGIPPGMGAQAHKHDLAPGTRCENPNHERNVREHRDEPYSEYEQYSHDPEVGGWAKDDFTSHGKDQTFCRDCAANRHAAGEDHTDWYAITKSQVTPHDQCTDCGKSLIHDALRSESKLAYQYEDVAPSHDWARLLTALGNPPARVLDVLKALGVPHQAARAAIDWATKSPASTEFEIDGVIHHAFHIGDGAILTDDGQAFPAHMASLVLAKGQEATANPTGGSATPGTDIPRLEDRDQSEKKLKKKHLLHHTNDAREHAHNFGYGLPWGGMYGWCGQCQGSGCGHCAGTGQVAIGNGMAQNPSDLSSDETPISDQSIDAGDMVGADGGGMNATGVLAAIDQESCPHDQGFNLHGQCKRCGYTPPTEADEPCDNPWCVQNEPEHTKGEHIDPPHLDPYHPDFQSAERGVEEAVGHHPDAWMFDHQPHGPSKYSVVTRIHLQAKQRGIGPALCGAQPDADHPNYKLATVPCERCAALAQGVGEVEERRMIHEAIYDTNSFGSGNPAQTHQRITPHVTSPNPASTGWATSADPTAWVQPIVNSSWGRWEAAKKPDSDEYTHAGVALKAKDSGRVLMIQRSNNDMKDPARGTWEFPGGGKENGDQTSLHTGIREFEEEVGHPFPEGGHLSHVHRSGNYILHTVVVPEESCLDFSNGRATVNPDDPDGDDHEQSAWWDPSHARKNPALRQECKTNDWNGIQKAATWNYTQQDMDSAPDEGPIVHAAGTRPQRRLRPGDHVLFDSGAAMKIRAASTSLFHLDHPSGRPMVMHRGPIEGDFSNVIEHKEAAEKRVDLDESGHGGLPERPHWVQPNGIDHCKTCGREHSDLNPSTGQCPTCDNWSNFVGDPKDRGPEGGSTHAWWMQGADPDRPMTGQHEPFSLKGWLPEDRTMHTTSSNSSVTTSTNLRGNGVEATYKPAGHTTDDDIALIFSGTLHDEPEGALPSTDGADGDPTEDPTEDPADLEAPGQDATEVGMPGVPLDRVAPWGYPESAADHPNPAIAQPPGPVDPYQPDPVDDEGSNSLFHTESSMVIVPDHVPDEFALAAQFEPVLADFSQTAGFKALAVDAKAPAGSDDGGPSDSDIARAAQALLQKQGMKDFSFAEQQELIGEGGGVARARNFQDLKVEGTHYANIEDDARLSDDEFLLL